MRCDSCNKFVSYDTENEPQIDGEEMAEDGTFTIELTHTLPCADCGTDLKSCSHTLEGKVDLPKCKKKGEAHDWSFNLETEALTDTITGRWEPVKKARGLAEKVKVQRDGKELEVSVLKVGDLRWYPWGQRYWRNQYGVKVTGDATCSNCDQSVDIEASQLVGAGEYEEC